MKYKITFELITASKSIEVEAENFTEAEDKALAQLSTDSTPDEEMSEWMVTDVEEVE
jgi:hypothetical protein